MLLQQKKFNPLEPNYDCMRFLLLLGDILNSLGIFTHCFHQINQICYRQLAETIQIFKELHLLFSAM